MTKRPRPMAPARTNPRPRQRLLPALIGAAVALLAGFWFVLGGADRWRSAPVELASTPDQNVLLVTVDTLRADALGCYGGAARPPEIDGVGGGGALLSFLCAA